MIRVSAGILLGEDGRILICRRGQGRANAHLWEFPGGKQEMGESPEACLRRELGEELGVRIRDVRPYERLVSGDIAFDFLTAALLGTPTLTEHEDAVFVSPRSLTDYPFCPADQPVALRLALEATPLRDFFWDLDGTLLDTYPVMVAAMDRALREEGVRESPPRLLTLMKDSLSQCLLTMAGEHGLAPDALAQAFRREEAAAASLIRPMPGIPQTLRALSDLGCRHYLVTHRDRRALDWLEGAGLLTLFRDAVTGEDGFPRKPRPEGLLHLISHHRLKPEACIMLGDRPLDVGAGRAAGIFTCLIDPENRFPQEPCTLRAATARGLSAILRPDTKAPQRLSTEDDHA